MTQNVELKAERTSPMDSPNKRNEVAKYLFGLSLAGQMNLWHWPGDKPELRRLPNGDYFTSRSIKADRRGRKAYLTLLKLADNILDIAATPHKDTPNG